MSKLSLKEQFKSFNEVCLLYVYGRLNFVLLGYLRSVRVSA